MPAYRGWPPGRPCRGRDGDLPYLCLSLVGPRSRARPGRPGGSAQPGPPPSPPSPLQLQTQVVELRQSGKLGPARIAPLVGLPASTLYRVLCRHRLNRLAWMDRPTGQPIRRYERAHPGELVHMDIKKLGRIPPGGGHRVHGRDAAHHRGRDRDAGQVAAPAMTTSTPPSTTTPGWPMPRSWPTNRQRPARGSGAEPGPCSPPTTSPSSGY